MAKIKISAPASPYSTIVDTEVMDVEITEVFLGIKLVTEEGKTLSISMRDQGFECQLNDGPFFGIGMVK